MKVKVLAVIEKQKLIKKGDNIVIGLSGGPDSMALLYVLLDIQKEIDFKIYVAHVNHGVRGIDALEDEKFVESLSKELNLPYYSESVNMDEYAKEQGLSSEEAGRKLRYEFFRQILSELGGGKIAVAHNKNDQAETLIMRFFRGTGIDGLRGMEYINGDIIRPLLGIERKEIEEYLRYKSIESRLDKTNLEPIYNRNKIRLELIPYIEENYNPNIIHTLWRTSKIATIDSDFLEEYANKIFNHIVKKNTKHSIILNGGLFLKEHKSIQQRIIRNCIFNINGNLQGFTERHISDTLRLFIEGGTGKSIDLINNIIVKTSYEDLIIEKKQETKEKRFLHKIKHEGITYVDEIGCGFQIKVYPIGKIKINEKDRFIKYFDYDKIKGSLYIRNRQDGDKFIPFGMNGSKKIKDYFIDEKIPKEKRDDIPIITDNENILWVVGYRSSNLYKITPNSKNVLAIRVINNYKDLRRIYMEDIVKEVLLTPEEIEAKVKELGKQITEDYKGKNLMLVGILKGAVIFMGDLAKNIDMPILMDFMAVSSYGKSSTSTGVVRIIKDLDCSIEDKDILIIEDIIDTGLTLSYLTDNLKKRGAKSVKICTLLDKPDRRKADVPVDYSGFSIPDEFVVGYGLDYAEKYRNLPYVAALKEEVYS